MQAMGVDKLMAVGGAVAALGCAVHCAGGSSAAGPAKVRGHGHGHEHGHGHGGGGAPAPDSASDHHGHGHDSEGNCVEEGSAHMHGLGHGRSHEKEPGNAQDHGHGHARAEAAPEPEPDSVADVQLQPSSRAALEGIDLLIDAFELPEAVGELQQLIATLRASPSNVNGCIQAMDVLGQCYMVLRKLSLAFETYDDLLNTVEADQSISGSNMYSAAYSIRGALHEKLARSGYASQRDADYEKATEAGCPEGYGRGLVDDFMDKHALYKQYKSKEAIPEEWVTHRAQYKLNHKVGEATQLLMEQDFAQAEASMSRELAALELTFQGESEADKAHAIIAAQSFRGMRAQARIGLGNVEGALEDFTTVIEMVSIDALLKEHHPPRYVCHVV